VAGGHRGWDRRRPGLGNRLDQSESVRGREGSQTNQAIRNLYGNGGKSDAIVAVTTLPRGTTGDSPGMRGQLAAAFDKIVAALPGSRAASYVSTGNRSFVSADGRTTFALIEARPSGEGRKSALRRSTPREPRRSRPVSPARRCT
jgi:hypothetical protein